MLKSRHLRSAASLPCLLAVLGLAACELTPHRIDADGMRQGNGAQRTDPKSYAQIIAAQQQRAAAPRATLPAATADNSRPADGSKYAPLVTTVPPAPQQAAPPPVAARPAAAPAAPDTGQLGTQAMLSASGEVLATRLRDQPAPPPAPAAPSPPPLAAASSIPEPPVVPVMRGDQEIRIPPAKPAAAPPPAAPPAPPAAAAPTTVAVAAPAPTPPPSPVKPEASPKQAFGRGAKTTAVATPSPAPAAIPRASSAPAAAPPPAAAQGNGNAFYGMPLPNLPPLQSPDEVNKAQLAQTQVARTDGSTAPQPAPAAPADRSAEAAQAQLQQAQNRIGLSDEQLQRLQAGQDHIASGDNGGAFLILESLNAELQKETRTYVVKDNESMWHVAGEPEVYGNSYLWPLVWQANRDKVKKPSQLYKGLKLIIPAHPTAQEVAEALAYSKSNNLEGMNQADSQ